ncbi:MAG TPA: carboxypeptidase regulatory-like domain-containing protein [Planctomycetota bacterium]|nr:carboxypeptidase regulatory-like domain-containing protein [Planctomycetota bacterium]
MARLAFVLAALGLLVGVLGACSGCSKEPAPAGGAAAGEVQEEKEDEAPPPPTTQGPPGRVHGKTRLEGKAPAPATFAITEPVCQEHHKTIASEEIVASPDGALANVLVHVKNAPAGGPPPAEPVVIDQKGCQYVPHAVAVQRGQRLVMRSSDAVLHNVHSYPKKSPVQNLAMTPGSAERELVFKQPEIGIRIACDVHPWMGAVVHVLKHSSFALTGADGAYAIAGLPPGRYTIEAVHEKLGTKTQTIDLAPGGDAELDFAFEVK